MNADPRHDAKSPPIPLNTDGTGEEDMMSFMKTHIESILKPYAENVYELHRTVLDLSSNLGALQEKSNVLEAHAARMDGMQEGQDKLKQFAESSRQFLDGFIDKSGQIEQERAQTIQNLTEAQTLIKSDMEELRKNGEDACRKLVVCQNAEEENNGRWVKLRSEFHRVADDLKRTDEAQAATMKQIASHESDLDAEIAQIKLQNKEMAQKLHATFMALNDQSMYKLNLLNAQFAEHESQLKQYREDFEQARDAITLSLKGIKDEFGPVQKETLAKFHRIHIDLLNHIRAVDAKGDDLNKLLSSQDQQHKEEMEDVRRNLGDLEAITSKHESKVAALQTATGVLPGRDKNRIDLLEEEAIDLGGKRHLRVEKCLGLEPMTKENMEAAKRVKKQKRASTMMLGDDQLTRKAWAAWMEAMYETKQDQIANAIPKMQEMLEKHHNLIETEKSKLYTTNDRVQTLEVDHTQLQEELQTLRESMNKNDGYWKGMTRGLQAAKKTMHTEGDGEMLPSATRLRNALPSRPLSSLVCQLPSSS